MPIVQGDSLSVSIAAASIVAKTARDNIMAAYHNIFPRYNFVNNKGYGTAEHLAAIRHFGPSPVHRRGFKGVKEYCND
jgi:ribonuclease HII